MNIDTQLMINSLFEELSLQGEKRVAVVIGRFNPPTKGHYAVIDKVKKFIRKNTSANLDITPVVVVIGGSKSDQDKNRNPLSVEERIQFMQASGNANGVTFLSAKNAFEAFALIRKNNMEPIAIAAGTDRADDYIRILDKHFTAADGSPLKHYKILLDRNEDAIETNKDEKQSAMDKALNIAKESGKDIDTDLVSGSLARRAVELDYFDEFASIVGLESKKALAKKMFEKIKAALTV